jgi:hypothetical protein
MKNEILSNAHFVKDLLYTTPETHESDEISSRSTSVSNNTVNSLTMKSDSLRSSPNSNSAHDESSSQSHSENEEKGFFEVESDWRDFPSHLELRKNTPFLNSLNPEHYLEIEEYSYEGIQGNELLTEADRENTSDKINISFSSSASNGRISSPIHTPSSRTNPLFPSSDSSSQNSSTHNQTPKLTADETPENTALTPTFPISAFDLQRERDGLNLASQERSREELKRESEEEKNEHLTTDYVGELFGGVRNGRENRNLIKESMSCVRRTQRSNNQLRMSRFSYTQGRRTRTPLSTLTQKKKGRSLFHHSDPVIKNIDFSDTPIKTLPR